MSQTFDVALFSGTERYQKAQTSGDKKLLFVNDHTLISKITYNTTFGWKNLKSQSVLKDTK